MAGEETPSLSEAFWLVARRLRHSSREALSGWDIAPSHARALNVIVRDGSMRLSDLSNHLRIAPRSTTEVVDGLEERGLVERQADETDRRATVVALTPEGRKVAAAIAATRAAQGDKLFGTLTDTERRQLARILAKLQGPRD